MNRKVWETINNERPSFVKAIKSAWKIVWRVFKAKSNNSKGTMWVDHNFPPIPDHLIKLGKITAWDSILKIELPFQFEHEKAVVGWHGNLKLHDDCYGYKSETTSTETDWESMEEKPYATRRYVVQYKPADYTLIVEFDSRLDGATCQVFTLDPGQEAKDPIFEIVCNQAEPV